MKLFKILTLAICFFTSALVNASLMLSTDDYITVEHNGIDLDWAWASNLNVQYFYQNDVLYNELLSPETLGWREATSDEFTFFSANVTSADFRRVGGGYKNASRFFNINSGNEYNINTTDFNRGDISSDFREGTTLDFTIWNLPENYWYETFYVRDSLAQVSGSTLIPEPLTTLIFATAFIILQTKLRKKSA